jgi:Kef-type K+ transport system membrane component KefB
MTIIPLESTKDQEGLNKGRSLVIYVVLLAVFALAALGVLQLGRDLQSTAGAATAVARSKPAQHAADLSRLLLQIGVIISASRSLGWLFRKLRQPQVVGEMVAGILLGPSLLGWLLPSASATLFPPASLGVLNGLSQVGLALFMFTIGLELDLELLQRRPHTAVLTSHVSIILPFLLGMVLSLFLYSSLAGDNVPFLHFALFMGISMSITAFPVLARILVERKMLGGTLGTITIACAAVDDVTAWCILAAVVALARADHASVSPWLTVTGTLAFCALMAFGVRRLLQAVARRRGEDEPLGENTLAVIFILLLASASVTEWLGIHALFGAFLMGSIMPREGKAIRQVHDKVSHVTVVLFLPIFFALTGLRTNVALLAGGERWLALAVIIVAATVGKFGGSSISARVSGLSWRDAMSLGVLMNTRGLMELVALNIGYDVGIISRPLFTMMVCMALFTTILTTPILEWINPEGSRQPESKSGESSEPCFESP